MDAEQVVVTADWLAARRAAPGLVVLEASVFLQPGNPGTFVSGYDTFLRDPRIPGARFADLFARFSDPASDLAFTRPDAAQFIADAGALGLRDSDHLVIYDRLSGQWAARLWWVLASHGHARTSVLEGGLRGYQQAGFAMETGAPEPVTPTEYDSKYMENQRFATRLDVEDVVAGQRPATLLCLLQPDDFAGRVQTRARAGHIPGSVNLPFSDLLDPVTRALLPAAILRQKFEAVVPLDGREIITYCGGGIASTIGSLALARIGYANTREYDGSLVDWIADPARPLTVTA